MRLSLVLPAFVSAAILAALTAAVVASDTPSTQTETPAPATKEVPVTFTGGFNTEGQDKGRPVILIAAALNVPADVFRKAFSNVKPAPAGSEPEPAQVRKNKQALMTALEPYGVTNDRLDEVSNFYRYNRSKGESWKHTPAAATATLTNGVLNAITLTNPGAGYSSTPKITIPGVTNPNLTITVAFTSDLKTNGSIKEITLSPTK